MKKCLLITAVGFFVIILSLNLISSLDVNIKSPSLGDVDKEDIYPGTGYCHVDWDCSFWGSCINGVRKRTCTDSNNCPFKYNKPVTQISCREPAFRKAPNTENQFFVFGMIVVVLLIIILIIMAGLL